MQVKKIVAFTLSAAMLGTSMYSDAMAQNDEPNEPIQLTDGQNPAGTSFGFWYNGYFGEGGQLLIPDALTGAFITQEAVEIGNSYDFDRDSVRIRGRHFDVGKAPELGEVDDTFAYEYSYYVGKVKVSDIVNLSISATMNKYTESDDNVWIHFEKTGPDYNSQDQFSSEFVNMMSEGGLKQSNAELVLNKAAASNRATEFKYDIYKNNAELTDNSAEDKNNAVTVTNGEDITLDVLRNADNGYIDSEGYTYIYVSSRYNASINVSYTENTNPGMSGVYLDGEQVESFDTAMNMAAGDTEAGDHTVTVYSDSTTNQNNKIQDNAVTLTIMNGDEGATVTQNSKNPILRSMCSGNVLNLGKEAATETNEGLSLILDANQKARILEMQATDGITNIYNNVVMQNGSTTIGGAIENKVGTINIYGGLFRNNTATTTTDDGGGAIITRGGTTNMYGGLITENVSENGRGSGVFVSGGTFHMYGGEIRNNESSDVYVKNSGFYMSGSAYAGTVILQEGRKINVESQFTTDRVHAVIKPEVYEEGTAVVTYTNGVTPNEKDFFVVSDGDQAYDLVVSGQDLVLEKCDRSYVESLYLAAGTYPNSVDGANYIKNEIEIPNSDGLENNIELLSTNDAFDDFEITWSSSDESTVSVDGTVTRPATGRKSVILTATVYFKGAETQRDIEVTVNGIDAYDYKLDITADKGIDLNKGMYGIFYEDINGAGDGGLYAELIENQSFEARHVYPDFSTEFDGLNEWTAIDGELALGESEPMNDNNPHYLHFEGTSFQNSAFDGVYMEAGKKYNVYFWAKSDSYDGTITVSAGGNSAVLVSDGLDNSWTKYTGVIEASEECRKVPFVVTLSKSGAVDFDMFSLIPDDAVDGLFRPDLYKNLEDLEPGFVRFPGGCVVEGDTTDLSGRYQWKNTVGNIEERVALWNRWGKYGGNMDHYMQPLGMGFYEMFKLCEDLGAEPLPILNCGLSCQNAFQNDTPNFPIGSPEFEQLLQDAVDLIDFANSTDFENNEWARLRRDMGHPEPFNMKMIGIGNEQWNTASSQYFARCDEFERVIHEKDPSIQIIACAHRSDAFPWAVEKNAENPNYVYALDEHNFNSSNYFFENTDHFDDYDRSVKVYSGEFAARYSERTNNTQNCLDTGLALAAYMTGIERNGDVVRMLSYAPLHSRIGYTQWSTNLVYFNDVESYRTPEYYAQMMFGTNMGDYTVKSELNKAGVDDLVYQTVSYNEEEKDIIVKLVNANTKEQVTIFDIDSSWNVKDNAKADVTVLTGPELNSRNSIDAPLTVSPVESEMTVGSSFRYTIPAQSVVILRIPANEEQEGDKKEILDDIKVENGTLTTLSVNLPEGIDNAVLYAAQYNDDNTLYSVKAVKAEPEIELNVKIEKGSVTLMLWTEGQKPIVDKKTVKNDSQIN